MESSGDLRADGGALMTETAQLISHELDHLVLQARSGLLESCSVEDLAALRSKSHLLDLLCGEAVAHKVSLQLHRSDSKAETQ